VSAANACTALTGVGAEEFLRIIADCTRPTLFRGLVSDWPVVQQARISPDAADRYLRQYYRGASVGLFYGESGIEGRFFYNRQMSGMNFDRSMSKLDTVLDRIREHRDRPDPPSFYVGSTTIDTCLPGFRAENDLDFGDRNPLASIWIGNRSRIAAHYDVPDNLACVVAGSRRFTLFPPDQLENLYPGPIDFTPAGQQISLVDFHRPDFVRFPRFRQALEKAIVADMMPGDALFLPSMWWHHVESLDSLNVLVNYWWRESPDYMGRPIDALYHALLSLRDLPAEQKNAWRVFFDHYVFSEDCPLDHIPHKSRGVLGEHDENSARKLRALLLNRLNR
jgi:hypothetical protein